MYMFGSGVMTVTPAGTAPQTPINIGLLQEGTFTVKRTTKKLFGQYVDPLAVGAGTRDWSGKAKVARFSARVLNALYFGGTLTIGGTGTDYYASSVPASTPYTVTPTIPSSGAWSADQGVIYAATGLPLTRVASGPTVGQYSLAAGVYTFAAADEGAAVTIAFNYTQTTVGSSIVVPQTLIGPTLSFGLNFTGVDPTNNGTFTGSFYNCVCSDFSFGTKLEDFAMPDFSFEMFTNGAGSVGSFNFPDGF